MKNAIKKYNAKKIDAEKRNIKFNLTFNEWYDWWLSNGVDKNKDALPRSKNTLCMCRFGDTGPYSLDNIYCATVSQNSKDLHKNKLLSCNRKQIITEVGNFNSIKEWCEQTGKSYNDWYKLARRKVKKDVANAG